MKCIEMIIFGFIIMYFLKKNNLEFMDMDDEDDDMDMNSEPGMGDKFSRIDNKVESSSNKQSDIDASGDGQNISGVNQSRKGKAQHSAPKSDPKKKKFEKKDGPKENCDIIKQITGQCAGGSSNMLLYALIGIVIYFICNKK